ncbi:Cutinase transcription factor 1 beta [Fusarium oxysporum f. sp. albedinis]|nr:Cutinase transcription factor 1 beta [Fusarium oxysporum f. sp. albedinis]
MDSAADNPINLFKILAITAAFSTVQSAPVETAEGKVTREQVNETHVNEAVVDDAVPQKGCVKEEAPHISTRERIYYEAGVSWM